MPQYRSGRGRQPGFYNRGMSVLLLLVLAADRPNILFAISDDQSFPHASAYGCQWVRTPAFDRVAAEGLLFEKCYTPNAKCAPSRSIILTGRNSWQLGAAANHVPIFPPEQPVYTEMLAESGYFVGSTGKGWGPGTSFTEDGRPRPLAGRPFNGNREQSPTSGISNKNYAANFDDFLAARDDEANGAPWCFWYGAHEPHRAYEYGSGAEKGGKSIRDIPEVPGYWPDSDIVRNDLLDYALEIEHFDRHLGRMLDALDRRGEAQNTIVVVTSDNGMPFPRAKGQSYEVSHHLPLAIRWPAGIAAPGRTVPDFVSFTDFAPTFVDAAGLDTFGLNPAGRTLWPIFDAEAIELDADGRAEPDRDGVILGKERHDLGRPGDAGYPSRGVVTGDWLYVKNLRPDYWPAGNPETGYLNTDGSPTKSLVLDLYRSGQDRHYWQQCFGRRPPVELYSLKPDPDCLTNLAGTDAVADVQSLLDRRLTEVLEEEGDPRATGLYRDGVADFDDYPYSDARMRDYHRKFTTGWTDDRGRPLTAPWTEPSDVGDEK